MTNKEKVRPYLKRLIIVMVISVVLTLGFNEVTYLGQKEAYDRPPQTVTLVIPPGTAQRVAAGGSEPGIPAEMIFVVGDMLEVKNEDSVDHQLGPIWVPPGTTGSLVMKEVNNLVYSCSFQPSRYLGIDVREPTTWTIRLIGLALAAPTFGVLAFLYSLLIFPLDKPLKKAASNGRVS